MARRKKKAGNSLDELNINTATVDITDIKKLIEQKLDEKYGEYIDPEPEILKFNIRPLDAILGGGLVIGMPVMVTGPAEIGKTTIGWQLIKEMQQQYPLSLSLYIDIEGSANVSNEDLGIKSRIELFDIDAGRVIYKPMTLSIEKTFELMEDTIKFKQELEKKLNKEIPLMIIWDSIADTDPEKIEDADNPNSLIGYKARLLQFELGKYKPLFRRNKVLLYIIDQVRANISDNMNNPYAGKQERQIGLINNLKSATGSKSVEHKLRQWIFLTRGPDILDKPDILGWYLDIHVVKSKLAPSGFSIRTVFDKRFGIDKFWTEYYFISNLTPTEELIFKKLGGSSSSTAKKFKSEIESTFSIKNAGSYKKLETIDPETGEVIQYPKSFYEKDAKELYYTDEEFRKIFDLAVEYNIKQRIIELFNPSNKYNINTKEILEEQSEQIEATIENSENISTEDPYSNLL